MSTFVKVDRYYVNLDAIAAVEETSDLLIVKFSAPIAHGVQSVNVKKASNDGIDLLKAVQERMAH